MVVIKASEVGQENLDGDKQSSPGRIEATFGVSNTVKLIMVPEFNEELCFYAVIDRAEFAKIKDVL